MSAYKVSIQAVPDYDLPHLTLPALTHHIV